MKREEFLDILRKTLHGEVDPDTIEQNIRYYDEYINTHLEGDEDGILEGLGDPRLIAKTIIDTERISRQKNKYTNSQGYSYGNERVHAEENSEEHSRYQGNSSRKNPVFFTNLKWYHKVLIVAILAIILILLLLVGRVLLRIVYVFAIPIILMALLYSLFRRR